MKTQISQFPPLLHEDYSGVYLQQGRMITDADWNAATRIARDRTEAGQRDSIGTGTPEAGGIIAGDPTAGYTLVWGDAYIDGVRAVLTPAAGAGAGFDFAAQADFPSAPSLPAGPYRLYLDVWERSLTALEDTDLLDPALHGADTSTRTRTMAQVKWAPVAFQPEDPDQNPTLGEGRLSVDLRAGLASGDPCEPCLDEIAVDGRVGNYAFRVEIHAVDRAASGAPERLTLKWSRENGAETARIGDTPPGFKASDWIYEFYNSAAEDSISESHAGFHHPDVIASGWTPGAGALTEGYPDTEPPGFSLVRRWDGYAELRRNGAIWVLDTRMVDGAEIPAAMDRDQRLSTVLGADQHGHVSTGATVLMALDTVTLRLELADHQHLAGDYWIAVVREALHDAGDRLLDAEPPAGIVHRYMGLMDVTPGDTVLLAGDACKRFQFPALTNLHADDVCYDNAACEMPGVSNVQEALDHLCRQKDLRWHNKHLHGWGIVCGLIVECCDDDDDDDGGGDEGGDEHAGTGRAGRDCVVLTKGYAIDCEGNDIVLHGAEHIDLLDDIRAHDAQMPATPILKEGNGTACLTIALEAGQPRISVEPHSNSGQSMMDKLLDGTLIGDFIQHCVLDMVEALTAELDFIEEGRAPSQDGKVLVSPARRKFISFWNLVSQTLWKANGPYIWMSRREYDILRALYLRLIDILGSKTFCAMFSEDSFPPYPFEGTNIDTWFGADQHTRVKPCPTGARVYTYGGADANIHVYDAGKGALVEIIRMNAAEGAEVTALACTPDGKRLYVAASVKGEDTVLGVAQVGDTHIFERPMQILCDVTLTEMEVARDDAGLIFAVGLGRGLFFLRPDVLAGEDKPKPEPMYAFNAVGQMVIDPVGKRAFATASAKTDEDVAPEIYDRIALCPLEGSESDTPAELPLFDLNERARSGSDDLAVLPGKSSQEPAQLYVVVDGIEASDDKEILTLQVDAGKPKDARPQAVLAVENTQIALATDVKTGVLYAAFEDSFRLQAIAADGVKVLQPRVPVQMQPTDVAVGAEGAVYAVNFLSSTLTAIPRDEVALSKERLAPLANLRWRILLAFYAMVGNLFQYLKDCLCHHLLVKCPECDGDEKIYLACVEIRDGTVYNICNFGKRKYVQTFMAWNYWLSVIPVIPLLKQAIAKTCCAVLPNFLDRFIDDIAPPPPAPELGAASGVSRPIKAKTTRNVITARKRTDTKRIWRQQTDKLTVYREFAGDATITARATKFPLKEGLRKEALHDAKTAETLRELDRAGIKDVTVVPYDPAKADEYALKYAQTSRTLSKKNTKVVVYERAGKTAFIAEERVGSGTDVSLSAVDTAKLAEIEARVARISDTSQAEENLAQIEARAEKIADTSEAQGKLAAVDASRARILADLSAAQISVNNLREEQAQEEARLKDLRAARSALKAEIDGLNEGLEAVAVMRKKMQVDIDSLRPVRELSGISERDAQLLERAGVRTIGDLSSTSTTALGNANVGSNVTARRSLIKKAQSRLK